MMCAWKELRSELPPTKDRYYLFGGYDDSHKFTFDKYHYATDGTINGWSIEIALRNGNAWWCSPNEPKIVTT